MYDIVLLHPPSSFNKLKYPLSGVFGALVGSTDVLGHEPVGMISMAQDLFQRGYKTKIFNIGKMLLDLRYEAVPDTNAIENFIKNLDARIYAIGLHWAAHAPGAIELARVIKQYHPDDVVLLGGITSTYYCKEIMEKFPFIDLVVMGEVDGLIHEIVDGLLHRKPYESISNLCYRKDGEPFSTALRPPIKQNIFYVRGLRNELIEPNTDFSKGDREPIRDCMIPLVHGCPYNCPFCGGSAHFYKECFCRNRAEVMSAEEVVANIRQSVNQGASGISLFGDVRFVGDGYWKDLTQELAREHIHFNLYLELFSPAPPEYMKAWRNTTSGHIIMAFSPESADPHVRHALGKHYSNEDIIKQVTLASDLGIGLSLGFMFALPKQDFTSIERTQDFINDLCHRFNRLISYMFEPFLFIDPGSLIFDHPEKYGYTVEDRTLEGLIKALSRPHWYFSLNYSTEWMSKKEIIDAMFFVGSSRNELYTEFLGPAEHNLFHKTLISQQKELVKILQRNPGLADEEIERIVERTLDPEFRQMNFSVTGPDFDALQQRPEEYSISSIFSNTSMMITKCYKEIEGETDLLSVFRDVGLFDEEIPVESYRAELMAEIKMGREIREISTKLPKIVWKRLHQLLSTLELSLEEGLMEAFVRYDWALFLVSLYGDTFLQELYEKGALPRDIRESNILLPLRNAYVKLNYKYDGKVIKKRHWLTMEKGPTYLLISYSGEAYPVTRREFDFLKGCGHRMPFLDFHKKASRFVGNSEDFLEWLITNGFVLFEPAVDIPRERA
jgi:B12-binding domain/radical SAM domain protein